MSRSDIILIKIKINVDIHNVFKVVVSNIERESYMYIRLSQNCNLLRKTWGLKIQMVAENATIKLLYGGKPEKLHLEVAPLIWKKSLIFVTNINKIFLVQKNFVKPITFILFADSSKSKLSWKNRSLYVLHKIFSHWFFEYVKTMFFRCIIKSGYQT